MGFQPKQLNNFLGYGLTLPLRIENGKWPIDSGVLLIRESLKMILCWDIGTRPFLIEFGSNVSRLLEEPNDDVLKQAIYAIVKEAIEKWEKRVELLDAEIDRPNFGSCFVKLTYKIKVGESIDTFVFPFYSKIDT